MSDCDLCVVRNRAVCAGLEPETRATLGRAGRMQTLRRGQALLWEGNESMLAANVVAGVLKLSTATSDGREQIVGLAYPSDFIGRPFGGTSQFSIVALVDSTLCVFARGSFGAVARRTPELEHALLTRTMNELDRARRWMLLLGRKAASERVASFLLELSERLAESHCAADGAPLSRFELPLDRQQIADVLGLTIETVSRQLSQLRSRGVIALPGRRSVTILDRSALSGAAGD